MELKVNFIILLFALVGISCSDDSKSDAYGQFEADKTTISAEVPGKLLWFNVEEGTKPGVGNYVGLIDTAQHHLRKTELQSAIQSVRTSIAKLDAQAEVYRSQLSTANKELTRLSALKEKNAATDQQLDAITGQVNTLEKQIASVQVQKQSVYAEVETLRSRITQVDDQLSRARIINPVEGVVLNVFAEPNELVMQGRPLYEIANLDEMTLKVYVSGAQLPSIVLDQSVEVFIDKDESTNESFTGKVSRISSEAEFTPRMIQTKEERVTQVYAIEVRVANPEGKIKIGMPGEVNFN